MNERSCASRRSFPVPLLAVTLILLGLLGSACGSSSDSSEGSDQAVEGTITFWSWGSPDPKVMDKAIDRFERENPKVRVKSVVQPFDAYFAQLRSALAARRGPDVAINYATPALFDFQQFIEPLGERVDEQARSELFGWGNVSTGLSETGTPYGLPFGGQGNALYYDKKAFARAGLDPEQPPTTWAEFLSACKALKGAGITPIAGGWKDGYYAEWWLDVLSEQLLSDPDLEQYRAAPDYTHPAFKQAAAALLELIEQGCFTDGSEGIPLFPDTSDAFASRKAAMFLGLISSDVYWGTYRDEYGDDLGVMLAPLLPDALNSDQHLVFYPNLSFMILKSSKHQAAAYAFARYMTRPSTQEILFRDAGSLPNVSDGLPTSDYGAAETVLGWVKDRTKRTPVIANIRPSVQAVFDRSVPLLVTGKMSVDEFLESVQDAQSKVTPIPGS